MKINSTLRVKNISKEARNDGYRGVLIETPTSTIYVDVDELPILIKVLKKKFKRIKAT